MRTRPIALAFLLAALALSAQAAPPAPPERFLAREATVVLASPSLRSTIEQARDVLPAIEGFPGGRKVRELRDRVERFLGFDPLEETEWIEDAGLDPTRPVAVSVGEGEDPSLMVLPVKSPDLFEVAAKRIARDRLELTDRKVDRGPRPIVSYRGEDPEKGFAYALAEGLAVVSTGRDAVETVRAALELPRDGQLGGFAPYRSAVDALGPQLALTTYISPLSSLARKEPFYSHGIGIGVGGGPGGLRSVLTFPFEPGARVLTARPRDPAPLLGMLSPDAALVIRGGVNPREVFGRKELEELARTDKNFDWLLRYGGGVLETLGGGWVVGVRAGEVPDEVLGDRFADTWPHRFRVEMVFELADPARLKAALGEWLRREPGMRALGPGGPWIAHERGAELGLAVVGKRLYVSMGKKGDLRALTRRTGSRLAPSSPAASAALRAKFGGLYLEAPRLAEALRAIPEEAFGEGARGEGGRQTALLVAEVADRFRMLAIQADVTRGALRVEVTGELAPQDRGEAAEETDED